MSTSIQKELSDFPKYKAAYIKAFDRMIAERNKAGLKTEWTSGSDVYHWWVNDGTIPGQMTFDGDLNILEDK